MRGSACPGSIYFLRRSCDRHMAIPIPTPTQPEHFDYRPAAQRAGLSVAQLAQIIRVFEADYPADLMLRELHILRACNALADGRATINDFQIEAPPASAA